MLRSRLDALFIWCGDAEFEPDGQGCTSNGVEMLVFFNRSFPRSCLEGGALCPGMMRCNALTVIHMVEQVGQINL